MAKKSARKEITKINLKQAALEGLSYERACETAKRAGKPSYRFTVGDKVQVGHLLNCVVDEILEDGHMYLIRSGANSDNYSCWAWTNVRPLDDDKDTHFAKRNSALSRLHYSNRSMYSLLSFQYLFGVDFNPDYQRGSVWDDEDREKLLDSIFMGREIGRFVFKQLPFTRTSNDGNYYEIVDGKQRMLTLLAFYENRFPYKGVFYNDLSAQDKNWFMDASIGVAEIDQSVTRAEVLEIFLAMNEGGKPVAKEVLDHARELLNEAYENAVKQYVLQKKDTAFEESLRKFLEHIDDTATIEFFANPTGWAERVVNVLDKNLTSRDGTPFSESIGKKFVAVQRLTQSRMLEFQSKPHCWESECRSLFAATAKAKNIRLVIEANGKEMQVQYPVSNLITFEMIKNKVISAWAIAPRKLSDEVKEFLAENCAGYSKYWSDIPMKTVSRIESGRKVLWENPYFEGNRK